MKSGSVAIATDPNSIWLWRDHSIHYVHADGAGRNNSSRPPLLLVHGFGASTDHWRKNIADLKQNFDVWAIDLLGFGRSAKPDLCYNGDLWRDQLTDFIQDMIGRPAVLVGNSLGGYASLCVAAGAPDVVAGVVLLNSAGPFSDALSQPSNNGFQQVWSKLVQSILLQPLPSYWLFQYARQRSTIRKTLQKVYLDQSAVTDQLVEEIYRPSCDVGAARVFASIFKAPRGEPVDVLLAQMRCPLLLLWGEADPWVNARDRSSKFRSHYSTLTEYFLQAGHCPHDEVPDQVNGLIRDWMHQIG